MAKIFKKDGALTARYRDLPAFKAIYEIEDNYQKSFDTYLKNGIGQTNKYLRSKYG